jgi:type I restriction enzyme, S subunit
VMDIPESWTSLLFGEVLLANGDRDGIRQGWSPQCEGFPSPSHKIWGVLKTTAIQDGWFLDHENKQLPADIEPRPALEVVNGDILMTCAGPRSRCGVVTYVKNTRPKLLISGKMYRFRCELQLMDDRFLVLFLRSHDAQKSIDRMKTGISDSGLNLTQARFTQLEIALPPLNEQHRIVAKIEELFSELDAGIASLKTARAQLKIYRQALLKHAFEGKLTEPWRKTHADQLESADQLLARIAKEREAHYQQQLQDWSKAVKKWELSGDEGKKPTKPRHPKELKQLDKDVRSKLAVLPLGWYWDVLGWTTCGVEYGTAAKSSESGTHVVLRMGNLQNGNIDWKDLAFSSDMDEINQYLLQSGDVLFNRTNSPEWVGKTAIYRGERPSLFAGYLIRANHLLTVVLGDYPFASG